jgi:type 1 glutamine amidotransferase
MKNKLFFFLILSCFTAGILTLAASRPEPVRILVVTGGHEYNKESFVGMLTALGSGFSFEIMEFPGAFEMFLPQNRDKYDVLVFYHMWQTITPEQQENLSGCIKEGKPLVVLHHSICAFDNWEEYVHITGGKYFHQSTTLHGTEYPPSSYEHDRHILVRVVDTLNPVTRNLRDFELFDETYKGYYVEPGIIPLLRTTDPTSTPVIGWETRYGKSRVVTIQSGHDTPTYQDENYRRLLRQAIIRVYSGK